MAALPQQQDFSQEWLNRLLSGGAATGNYMPSSEPGAGAAGGVIGGPVSGGANWASVQQYLNAQQPNTGSVGRRRSAMVSDLQLQGGNDEEDDNDAPGDDDDEDYQPSSGGGRRRGSARGTRGATTRSGGHREGDSDGDGSQDGDDGVRRRPPTTMSAWDKSEYDVLLSMVRQMGHAWRHIADRLNRPPGAVKNTYYSLLRKIARAQAGKKTRKKAGDVDIDNFLNQDLLEQEKLIKEGKLGLGGPGGAPVGLSISEEGVDGSSLSSGGESAPAFAGAQIAGAKRKKGGKQAAKAGSTVEGQSDEDQVAGPVQAKKPAKKRPRKGESEAAVDEEEALQQSAAVPGFHGAPRKGGGMRVDNRFQAASFSSSSAGLSEAPAEEEYFAPQYEAGGVGASSSSGDAQDYDQYGRRLYEEQYQYGGRGLAIERAASAAEGSEAADVDASRGKKKGQRKHRHQREPETPESSPVEASPYRHPNERRERRHGRGLDDSDKLMDEPLFDEEEYKAMAARLGGVYSQASRAATAARLNMIKGRDRYPLRGNGAAKAGTATSSLSSAMAGGLQLPSTATAASTLAAAFAPRPTVDTSAGMLHSSAANAATLLGAGGILLGPFGPASTPGNLDLLAGFGPTSGIMVKENNGEEGSSSSTAGAALEPGEVRATGPMFNGRRLSRPRRADIGAGDGIIVALLPLTPGTPGTVLGTEVDAAAAERAVTDAPAGGFRAVFSPTMASSSSSSSSSSGAGQQPESSSSASSTAAGAARMVEFAEGRLVGLAKSAATSKPPSQSPSPAGPVVMKAAEEDDDADLLKFHLRASTGPVTRAADASPPLNGDNGNGAENRAVSRNAVTGGLGLPNPSPIADDDDLQSTMASTAEASAAAGTLRPYSPASSDANAGLLDAPGRSRQPSATSLDSNISQYPAANASSAPQAAAPAGRLPFSSPQAAMALSGFDSIDAETSLAALSDLEDEALHSEVGISTAARPHASVATRASSATGQAPAITSPRPSHGPSAQLPYGTRGAARSARSAEEEGQGPLLSARSRLSAKTRNDQERTGSQFPVSPLAAAPKSAVIAQRQQDARRPSLEDLAAAAPIALGEQPRPSASSAAPAVSGNPSPTLAQVPQQQQQPVIAAPFAAFQPYAPRSGLSPFLEMQRAHRLISDVAADKASGTSGSTAEGGEGRTATTGVSSSSSSSASGISTAPGAGDKQGSSQGAAPSSSGSLNFFSLLASQQQQQPLPPYLPMPFAGLGFEGAAQALSPFAEQFLKEKREKAMAEAPKPPVEGGEAKQTDSTGTT